MLTPLPSGSLVCSEKHGLSALWVLSSSSGQTLEVTGASDREGHVDPAWPDKIADTYMKLTRHPPKHFITCISLFNLQALCKVNTGISPIL